MEMSRETSELFSALSKAQSEFKVAKFDKKAVYGDYASLTSVRESCIEALTKHGLSMVQPVTFNGAHYEMLTQLNHSSGQYMRSTIRLILDKNNMQGLGSAITYAKRYAWAAMVGIVSDSDDDGNTAVGRQPNGEKHSPPPKKTAAEMQNRKPGTVQNMAPASKDLLEMVTNLCIDRQINEFVVQKLMRDGYSVNPKVPPTWVVKEIVDLLSIEDTTEATVMAQVVKIQNRREAALKSGGQQ
jgi:hypothetical protein